METAVSLIPGLVIALFVAFTVLRAVRIVPQARARNVERLGRYEVHLDRKLERMLAMLLRLKDLRQGTVAG